MKSESKPETALVLKAAAVYTGLPRPRSARFLQFPSDDLYRFPVIRQKPTARSRSTETIIRGDQVTNLKLMSTVETLHRLHETSPFRKGVSPEIAPASGSFSFGQEGREAPMNTVNSEASHSSHKTEESKRQKDLETSGDERGESSFEVSPVRNLPLRTIESGDSVMRSDSLQDEFGLKRRSRRSIRSAIRDYSEDIPSDEEAEASMSSSDVLGDRLVRLSTNKDFKRIVELIPEEFEDDSRLMFKSIDALRQAGVIEEDDEESEADVDISAEQVHLVPREIQVKANKPFCDMRQVQPKILGNSTIQISTESLDLAMGGPDGNSPLIRKILVCEEHKKATGGKAGLDILCSLSCAGYKTTVGLVFSNVEGRSRAGVNYAKEAEKLPVQLLTPSIVRFFQSTTVLWLTCGFEHCAVVSIEGEVFTWGHGGSGALGHGNTLSYQTPTRVQALAGQGVIYLESGGYHNAAVSSSGSLYVWGRGDVNQLGINFKQLIYDELGYLALAPILVQEFERWRKSIQSVACGEAHTLVLDTNGAVYAFGWAEDGQLGLPESAISEGMMTTKIEPLHDLRQVSKVSAGSLFSAALTESGQVYTWGNGEQGQLGLGSKALRRDRPSLVPNLDRVVDITCGENFVLALCDGGKVVGWGQGVAGAFDGGQFTQGSELVCYVPRTLIEIDIAHHIALQRQKSSAEQPSFLWALEEELRRLEQEE